MADWTFAAANRFLEQLIRSGVKLGLDNTQRLLAAVGRPDRALTIVHVAGTNGKGSVCALLAAALEHAGLRVGLFTSPHLVSIRERLRVNRQPIGAQEFADIAADIRVQAANLFNGEAECRPTFFEFLAVLGFEFFRRRQVDVAVVEVGLGGRLDATNVVTPAVTVITEIDLEHTQALGGTLAAIAGEKAGIIKPGVPVVCGVRKREASARIRHVAAGVRAPFVSLGQAFDGLGRRLDDGRTLPMHVHTVRWHARREVIRTYLLGGHQTRNVAIAFAALNVFAEHVRPVDIAAGVAGMADVVWPARLQFLPNGLLVDAAHNPSAVETLTDALAELHPGRTWPVLFGVAADKDWRGMLDRMRPFIAELNVVTIDNPRARGAAEMTAAMRPAWPDITVRSCANVHDGLGRLLAAGRGVVMGSIFLAGDVLGRLNGTQPVSLQPQAWQPDDSPTP